MHLLGQFDTRELVYLATAADFVWNPKQWESAESYRRAVRFVTVMRGILEDGAATSTRSSDDLR